MTRTFCRRELVYLERELEVGLVAQVCSDRHAVSGPGVRPEPPFPGHSVPGGGLAAHAVSLVAHGPIQLYGPGLAQPGDGLAVMVLTLASAPEASRRGPRSPVGGSSRPFLSSRPTLVGTPDRRCNLQWFLLCRGHTSGVHHSFRNLGAGSQRESAVSFSHRSRSNRFTE